MPSDKPLVHLVMDPDLIKRLDDFRFTHRFQSRAAAIKWLLEAALDRGLHPVVGESATSTVGLGKEMAS